MILNCSFLYRSMYHVDGVSSKLAFAQRAIYCDAFIIVSMREIATIVMQTGWGRDSMWRYLALVQGRGVTGKKAVCSGNSSLQERVSTWERTWKGLKEFKRTSKLPTSVTEQLPLLQGQVLKRTEMAGSSEERWDFPTSGGIFFFCVDSLMYKVDILSRRSV